MTSHLLTAPTPTPEAEELTTYMFVTVRVPGKKKIETFMSMAAWRRQLDGQSQFIVGANGPHSEEYVDDFRLRHPSVGLMF